MKPEPTDMTKHTLPQNKDWRELAEDLLARFPGVDRSEILKRLVGISFYNIRHGNKREERAACDFLNEVQTQALSMLRKKS